VTPAYE
ncbi:putative aRAC-type regulatory protein, partial [Escherichia coli 3.4870]